MPIVSTSGFDFAFAFGPERAAARQCARSRGFSLVEMLLVTVLVASGAMAAAPSLSQWQARDRVDGAARALIAGLSFARGEAIARGARVVLCPTDGSARCMPKGRTCAAGLFDWSCGWAVVVGPRHAGQALRIYRRMPGVSIAAGPANVEFTPPAGQVIGGFRRFEVAAQGVAPRVGSDALRRCVRIAAGGRARLDPGPCDGRPRA